jgi:hypothetical protein
MKWLFIVVVIPIVLLVWRELEMREKRNERDELVKSIRKELIVVRDDILKEIRSK